jgi:phosphoesterase, MJ0936 family
MLIALLSDIHGNLPALKAAVIEAKTRGAMQIICAGDIVGYGPFPNEVCEYLKTNEIKSISGNYDIKVLDVIEHGKSAVDSLQKKKRELVMWTAKHLEKTAQRFLRDLPVSLEEELPGGRNLLVVHGSPVSNDDDIYPSITPKGLETKLKNARPDILVCGHTHIPFVKKVSGMLVVNCGSAGQSVDGDPRPSYAIISVDEKSASGRIIRFKYDINETIKALKNTSLPKTLQNDFLEGSKRRFLQ